MVARMLEQNHLTTADVELVNVEPENALLALQAHQVDAVHSYEPHREPDGNPGLSHPLLQRRKRPASCPTC